MLLLDVGNSRCKWARIEKGVWAQQGVVANTEWRALLQVFSALPIPSRIVVSNVAGDAMAEPLHRLFSAWPSARVQSISACTWQCGVSNQYDQPESLGSDRWAALIAAWQCQHQACLIVNCGTATTIDTLSDAGEFLGGLILPGITLMKKSLLGDTALLTNTQGQLQNLPLNTADAIWSGIIRASLGAIEHQHALLKSTVTPVCILSGGAAGEIQAHLGIPVRRMDNLVLEGLKIIGEASA